MPEAQKTILENLLSKIDDTEAVDEALGGRTLLGTPVYPRTPDYFPSEPRDLFWQMDKIADPSGNLVPIDFDTNGDGTIDDKERNAIRGRNTWLVWGGGNEAFWGWLQERGYGIIDFLILADARSRGTRFAEKGLMNQPGFENPKDHEKGQPPYNLELKESLGLYIDATAIDPWLKTPPHIDDSEPETEQNEESGRDSGAEGASDPDGAPDQSSQHADDYASAERKLTADQRAEAVAAATRKYAYMPEQYSLNGTAHEKPVPIPTLPGNARHDRNLFEPGDATLMATVKNAMPKDGLDYSVYGYPSGIFGLRYFLNPDFFGKTDEAEEARDYWQVRVVESGRDYYTDPKIHADPKLVRPFRPSMSCGFCHIGPHPLLPPKDPEAPDWENLSSIIGSQYWLPQPVFAGRAPRGNFLHHFLNSQPPGTIDTSLVSTDQINNTNVINAIFDVPARLDRARTKPPEIQSGANLLFLGKQTTDEDVPLHCPMVLFPGEDSVGVVPALARVHLNIGLFSEQWERVDNPVIGFRPQRPFALETCRTNSVFWMVNEQFRMPYMASFFTHQKKVGNTSLKATQAMKLEHAVGAGPAPKPTRVSAGREVFLENCAICHSSKQPEGFDLNFSRTVEGGWLTREGPKKGKPLHYTLPMDYADWESFRASPAFDHYRSKISKIAEDQGDKFLQDNFLSNELRIPITLVGTNSKRALATNAMAGNVWDNYSSKTFKEMKSVGKIRYFDIFSKEAQVDNFGNNAEFDDGRESGGPGYLRPPSLISVWATAPYFHNNALGLYNHDPSVEGRLAAFEDGIGKLLNQDMRRVPAAGYDATNGNYSHLFGDLRRESSAISANDPGYIYRVPIDTHVEMAAGFIPILLTGIVGEKLFGFLKFWLWLILILLFAWIAWKGQPRHAGILFLGVAIVFAALLALSGVGGIGGSVAGALMVMTTRMAEWSSGWLWLIPLGLAAFGLFLSFTRLRLLKTIRIAFLVLALLTAAAGLLANKFLTGNLKDRNLIVALLPNSWISGEYKGIHVGPIPKGVPVDLLMNMDPEKKDKLPAAVISLARANLKIKIQKKKQNLSAEDTYRIFADIAGPALLEASKCPDFVLDRGHWFGEELTDKEKADLTEFLKTL